MGEVIDPDRADCKVVDRRSNKAGRTLYAGLGTMRERPADSQRGSKVWFEKILAAPTPGEAKDFAKRSVIPLPPPHLIAQASTESSYQVKLVTPDTEVKDLCVLVTKFTGKEPPYVTTEIHILDKPFDPEEEQQAIKNGGNCV